jgi:hypothetical protein
MIPRDTPAGTKVWAVEQDHEDQHVADCVPCTLAGWVGDSPEVFVEDEDLYLVHEVEDVYPTEWEAALGAINWHAGMARWHLGEIDKWAAVAAGEGVRR